MHNVDLYLYSISFGVSNQTTFMLMNIAFHEHLETSVFKKSPWNVSNREKRNAWDSLAVGISFNFVFLHLLFVVVFLSLSSSCSFGMGIKLVINLYFVKDMTILMTLWFLFLCIISLY